MQVKIKNQAHIDIGVKATLANIAAKDLELESNPGSCRLQCILSLDLYSRVFISCVTLKVARITLNK